VELQEKKARWPETWVAPVPLTGPPWTQVEEQSAWMAPVFVGILELVEAGKLPAQAELRFLAEVAQHRRAAVPAGCERVLSFAQAVPVRCHRPGDRSRNRQA
jgi:hypothetical protein